MEQHSFRVDGNVIKNKGKQLCMTSNTMEVNEGRVLSHEF